MAAIDATNLVFGRLASIVAKRLLKGESLEVLNAEKSVILGRKEAIYAKYRTRVSLRAKGNPEKGPKFSRMPDRVFRYAVSGMLPKKSKRGRDALKRLKVFIGNPGNIAEAEKIVYAKNERLDNFIELGKLCRELGAKW